MVNATLYLTALLDNWKKREQPRHDMMAWIFLRGLGIILFSAFASFGVQAQALIGSHGIIPLHDFIEFLRGQGNTPGIAPMLFWLNDSDTMINAVCWGGAVFSLILAAGFIPRISLIVIYACYLSLIHAGRYFMTFQWDFLLIETVFLAFIMCSARNPGVWLLRWLMFCFMFGSGMVKIASGDESWRDFTALYYHFETQPLPNPVAWYAHQLPPVILQFGALATLFVELVMPFFIFGPRLWRFTAAFSFILLQTTILLTGNYNFFNLTALLLCLPLFDDRALRKIFPVRTHKLLERIRPLETHKAVSFTCGLILLWVVVYGSIQFQTKYSSTEAPAAFASIEGTLQPFALVNTYGPFAVMTRQRNEIVIEGSADGITWKEYDLKYKPGDVKRGPSWNIPHQPRVDWQFWFASLDPPSNGIWFTGLLQRLLEDEPVVLDLFAVNPFPDNPPKYIRALFYDYQFTTLQERRETGAYWKRQYLGVYFPETRLK